MKGPGPSPCLLVVGGIPGGMLFLGMLVLCIFVCVCVWVVWFLPVSVPFTPRSLTNIQPMLFKLTPLFGCSCPFRSFELRALLLLSGVWGGCFQLLPSCSSACRAHGEPPATKCKLTSFALHGMLFALALRLLQLFSECTLIDIIKVGEEGLFDCAFGVLAES